MIAAEENVTIHIEPDNEKERLEGTESDRIDTSRKSVSRIGLEDDQDADKDG